jgi:phosphoribosylformylglycinamidine synthase subunit PurQ / glutaminase
VYFVSQDSIKIAVIQYPGTNCENETAAAINQAGMQADVFRWNNDPGTLPVYQGYVLAGGFSYQDRVRAGAIAAKKNIVDSLMAEAQKGKPILGICNGAQVLVETGMVPGIAWGDIQMALAANRTGSRSGYHCDWVFLKCEQQETAGCFSLEFSPDDVIPIPVAHAEGCFTSQIDGLLETLQNHRQIGFTYCDANGTTIPDFPVNPNGSMANIAGLYNKEGNVLALMPHPERASWIRQIPFDLPGPYGLARNEAWKMNSGFLDFGPGMKFFQSMKRYIMKRQGK